MSLFFAGPADSDPATEIGDRTTDVLEPRGSHVEMALGIINEDGEGSDDGMDPGGDLARMIMEIIEDDDAQVTSGYSPQPFEVTPYQDYGDMQPPPKPSQGTNWQAPTSRFPTSYERSGCTRTGAGDGGINSGSLSSTLLAFSTAAATVDPQSIPHGSARFDTPDLASQSLGVDRRPLIHLGPRFKEQLPFYRPKATAPQQTNAQQTGMTAYLYTDFVPYSELRVSMAATDYPTRHGSFGTPPPPAFSFQTKMSGRQSSFFDSTWNPKGSVPSGVPRDTLPPAQPAVFGLQPLIPPGEPTARPGIPTSLRRLKSTNYTEVQGVLPPPSSLPRTTTKLEPTKIECAPQCSPPSKTSLGVFSPANEALESALITERAEGKHEKDAKKPVTSPGSVADNEPLGAHKGGKTRRKRRRAGRSHRERTANFHALQGESGLTSINEVKRYRKDKYELALAMNTLSNLRNDRDYFSE